jgi:hypothetical protein
VWWRCHRRIITDYLLAYGATVFHILKEGHPERAHMTPGAKCNPRGILSYSARSNRSSADRASTSGRKVGYGR